MKASIKRCEFGKETPSLATKLNGAFQSKVEACYLKS